MPLDDGPVHGGGDEEANVKPYDCGIHGGQWKGDARPRCPVCSAGERADAIPETAVEVVAKALGRYDAPEHWDWREYEEPARMVVAALRAAHPEAGSEEAERALLCTCADKCQKQEGARCYDTQTIRERQDTVPLAGLEGALTEAVFTYLNDCVGYREPWDEGGLANAVEAVLARLRAEDEENDA